MLSMSGEIVGINIYRIDESRSGRTAEGLGFAVSEQTVQQQIPALKIARAAPTPTPTRRPTPTPVPWTSQNDEVCEAFSEFMYEAAYLDLTGEEVIRVLEEAGMNERTIVILLRECMGHLLE